MWGNLEQWTQTMSADTTLGRAWPNGHAAHWNTKCSQTQRLSSYRSGLATTQCGPAMASGNAVMRVMCSWTRVRTAQQLCRGQSIGGELMTHTCLHQDIINLIIVFLMCHIFWCLSSNRWIVDAAAMLPLNWLLAQRAIKPHIIIGVVCNSKPLLCVFIIL